MSSEKLTIKLEYDRLFLRSVRLRVPELRLDEQLSNMNRFDKIPKGRYRGTLTLEMADNKTVRQDITLNVGAGSENLHVIDLYHLPQNVRIRPVDTQGQVVAGTEVKIETIDASFRPVRGNDGAVYALRPALYSVKVLLADLTVKSFKIDVREGQEDYPLVVLENSDSRAASRVEVSVPVGYMTAGGTWHSTRSINMSASGACLLRQNPDPIQGKVYLRMLLDDSTVECLASVRWNKEKREDLPKMGVEFQMDEKTRTRLEKWLNMTASMKSVSHNFMNR